MELSREIPACVPEKFDYVPHSDKCKYMGFRFSLAISYGIVNLFEWYMGI